jgi:ubiquinone/menaquinone biosynthesis C-methylase UbiE
MKTLAHKQKLIDLLGDCENAVILDYGCGKGDFIKLLLSSNKKPSKIIAADSNTVMLKSIQDTFSNATNSGLVIPQHTNTPAELKNIQFDKIICHNVLECIDDKLNFINSFKPLLKQDATFILSHHDFDSAICNSSYKQLSRDLIHHFADTQQDWQKHSDGQMGRKLPGLVNHSVFGECAEHSTWRLIDTTFKPGCYGYLMANMLIEIGKNKFKDAELKSWLDDLINKNMHNEFYFAIDLVVSKISMNPLIK